MPDPIPRLNAALEGRYHIERELGAGGMATVYLADDLRHERKVAIKVLKPELAAVIGAERFLSEIKTTANLQHPNILPLFDSGEAGGFLFYVMPYIEGETLRDRLDSEKQLPVEEAVRVASDVAEALHAAHDQGVIHRDIKPANILLSRGRPLVADFGIALAVSTAGGGRLTQSGMSLGTPYYMSPEQATGDPQLGPTTDIYALGCVLYEMLVGGPPFKGSTPQAILSEIIVGEAPSASTERKAVPPNVDAVIDKALERVAADRFQSAADFAKSLRDPGFRHGSGIRAGSTPASGNWSALTIAFASLFLLATAVAGWSILRPDSPGSVERFLLDIDLDPESGLDLSRDGSALVFVGQDESGQRQLWLQRLGELAPTAIPGTQAPAIASPRLSSGAEVSFIVGRQLKVAALEGGAVRTLAEDAYCCARWGNDGFIYYTALRFAVNRVSVSDGTVEGVTHQEEGDDVHRDFQVLPGGEVAIFSVRGATDRIEVTRLSSGERQVLTQGVRPYVTRAGHLVFGSLDGQILVAQLDVENMRLARAAVPLVEGVYVKPAYYGGQSDLMYSLSETGTLAYLAGAGVGADRWEFVWVTRSGESTPVDSGFSFVPPTRSIGWRLSPDDSRVAFNSVVDGNNDIRIKHLPGGPEERITSYEGQDYRPFWTPDGRRLTYFSGPTADDRNVWSRRADGSGEAELLLDDGRSFANGTWSPDGRSLLLRAAGVTVSMGQRDIFTFRPGVDSVAQPLLANPEFREDEPALSPNGRWLAYSSNETGRLEVYVRPFPNVDSTRLPVSSDGGVGPLWANSGRELFFVNGARELVAVQFDQVAGQLLTQEALFTIPPESPVAPGNNFYDVSSDDQRFLMARNYRGESRDVNRPKLVLVRNWFEELKRLVPN